MITLPILITKMVQSVGKNVVCRCFGQEDVHINDE